MILHLISDRHRLAGAAVDHALEFSCLEQQVRYAVEARIDVVQIRERDLEGKRLASLVRQIRAITAGTRTRVVVNDRVDVAVAAGADGVHLRGDSMPATAVRTIVPRGFLVGRSIHSGDDVEAAGREVDYLIAGTVWATSSKSNGAAMLGPEGLAKIVAAARVPVLAIGGVTESRVREVAATGAAGIAAIGLFMRQGIEPGCRATRLLELVQSIRGRCDNGL